MPGFICDPGFVYRNQVDEWFDHQIVLLINSGCDFGVDTNGRKYFLNRTTVTNQTRNAMKALQVKGWPEKAWHKANAGMITPATDFTAAAFTASQVNDNQKTDIMISALAVGVITIPQGLARGTLTQAIEAVVANPSSDRKVSELQSLVDEGHVTLTPYTATEDLQRSLSGGTWLQASR